MTIPFVYGESFPALLLVSGSITASLSAIRPNHSTPSLFPPSQTSQVACPASNVTYELTGLNGSIAWDEAACHQTLCNPCHWLMRVPPTYELFVEFEHVDLWFQNALFSIPDAKFYDRSRWEAWDSVVVLCLESGVVCPPRLERQTELRRVEGRLAVAPLWAQNVSTLHLKLFESTDKAFFRAKDTGRRVWSSFRVRYRALRRQTFPKKDINWLQHLFGAKWNLCINHTEPPPSFLCNKFPQCYKIFPAMRYMDERDCGYAAEGCGPRLAPFRDECFQVHSRNVAVNVFGKDYLNTPVCSTEIPHTDYAAFLDPEFRNFAIEGLLLLGRRQIFLGVQRFAAEGVGVAGYLSQLYRFVWWSRLHRTAVHDPSLMQYANFSKQCAEIYVALSGVVSMRSISCADGGRHEYVHLCHRYNPTRLHTYRSRKVRILAHANTHPDDVHFKRCPAGFFVHHFHPCGLSSASGRDLSSSGLPLFRCSNDAKIHYTLTCDGHGDCGDGSDETTCDSPAARMKARIPGLFFCRDSHEVIPANRTCDATPDCFDVSDESQCTKCAKGADLWSPRENWLICIKYLGEFYSKRQVTIHTSWFMPDFKFHQKAVLNDMRPWLVEMDGNGGSYLRRHRSVADCPETHVRCPDAYCIPTYMVNNGIHDCPYLHTDDEWALKTQAKEEVENFTCLGFYRCYRSPVCLHVLYMCDGVHHCPYKDDERFCGVHRQCPKQCRCEGLALTCTHSVSPAEVYFARYLDLSGTERPTLDDFHLMGLLHFLNVSSCALTTLSLKYMDHLRVLDASRNQLSSLQNVRLADMPALTFVDLSHNPRLLLDHGLLKDFLYVPEDRRKLEILILKNTGMESAKARMFESATALKTLDLRENKIARVDRASLHGLIRLDYLAADEVRLCCMYSETFPASKAKCEAPEDELSSCEDLLRSQFFRVSLWLLSLLAVLGNAGILAYRLLVEAEGLRTGYRVLVTHLALSDLCMGLYMALIGSADAHYSDRYLWHQWEWTHSVTCRVAGSLALLSSEVSALTVCLVMLDRLLALRFPLRRRLRFSRRSASVACGVVWTAGLTLVVVPLLEVTEDWEFYSQTAICLPLPITRKDFPGHAYAFAVFVSLNFVIFLVIGVGQLVIFLTIHNAPVVGRADRTQQDIAIARRLFGVVLTDFCCWFPVGVMGLMSANGVPIPGSLNVAAAIFVLPLNSALNPFLYTLNTALERRRKSRENQRVKALMMSLQNDVNAWPADKVDQLLRNLLKARRVNVAGWEADQMLRLLHNVRLDTWTESQILQLFRNIRADQWPADRVIALFRTVDLSCWTSEQRGRLFGSATTDRHH